MEKTKKAQSEMVGFGIIIIIVAILIVIFVALTLQKKPVTTHDAQTESFVQSVLQFTTTCERNSHYLSYTDLVGFCSENGQCDSGEDSCKILNSTSENLVESAWKTGADFPTKGYSFNVNYAGNYLVNLTKGNETANARGAVQTFNGNLQVSFTGYF